MLEQSAQINLKQHATPRFHPLVVVALVPIALAILVLSTSPNYQTFDSERASPYGGDFLQEWIGGHIVTAELRSNASDQRSKLYELEHFKALQHDPSLVGFEWTPSDYYPPIYSPGYYLLFSPLSQIPYHVAAKIWLAFSLVCFFVTFAMFYKFHPVGQRMGGFAPIVAAIFTPLLFSLNIGHKSIFILMVFTATYLLLFHRKHFLAGTCLGLIAFKPHFIVVVALLMLIQRDWRFLSGLFACGVAWIGLCLIAGPQHFVEYLAVLLGTADYTNSSGYDLTMAHSFFSASQLSLGWLGSGLSKSLALVFVLVSLVGFGRMANQFYRRSKASTSSSGNPSNASATDCNTRSKPFALLFSAAIVLTVLASPHFYHYDLTILLLPVLLTIGYVDFKSAETKKPALAVGAILIGLFVMAGMFQPIAVAISIQLSLVFLVAWLVLLLYFTGSFNQRDVSSAVT